MVDAIEIARQRHSLHLWAYVIMPEHVHLLFWPTCPEYSVSSILTTLKQSVSKRALLYVRANAPAFLNQMLDKQPSGKARYRFWQRGGGYDRNLMEPRTIWSEIDYIHANPVRRGLCQSATDWPWSSACEYRSLGSGKLRLDTSSLPRTSKG